MKKRGFTLIELLVVIAIIAVLSAILMPVFAQAKSSAKATQCHVQLRQIAISWTLYAQDSDDTACPSYYYSADYSTEAAWDFSFNYTSSTAAKPGLLGPYLKSDSIHQCPEFHGQSWGRPFTGFAYNASYVGGDLFAGIPAASLGQISDPSGTAVFADAGYGNPTQGCNFLRAPSDALFVAGKVHFRHAGHASILWADSHASRAAARHHVEGKGAHITGALSQGDESYDLQ